MSVSLTNPNHDHDHVPVSLFSPAPPRLRIRRKAMMDMDGDGGNVDMNTSIGTDWEIIDADCSLRRPYEQYGRSRSKRYWREGGPPPHPVIVQLRVVDPAASSSSSSSAGPVSSSPSRDRQNRPQESANADSDDPPYTNLTSYTQLFRRTPYYFMFASLAKPDDDTELHWLKDGHTRYTTGSVVSSLYAFKDPTAPGASTNNGDASRSPAAAKYRPTTRPPRPTRASSSSPTSVRREGSYRLKLSLFRGLWERRPPLQEHLQRAVLHPHRENVPQRESVHVNFWRAGEECGEDAYLELRILSLTCSLPDQGIKIRIRTGIRMRKTRHPAVGVDVGVGGPLPSGAGGEHAHEFLFWVVRRTRSTMLGAGMRLAVLDVCA
ncbi:hypothetical protein K438DRAFT_1749633 [Mycena galopus ATCC 62051]|nr:hypothetical protein K438DRAFT_1749633 [Mycena galopus ATCC 62051]